MAVETRQTLSLLTEAIPAIDGINDASQARVVLYQAARKVNAPLDKVGLLPTQTAAATYLPLTGGTVTGNITMTGHLIPSPTATWDLGSATNRWRTIYTSDLSLKNEHGDWTIVEGEEDLFITNNRTGKRYRFVLEEA